MTVWLWLNLALASLFVLAMVGVPLWLVISRPDSGAAPAQLPAWWWARERRAAQAAAARHRAARPRWNPAAEN